MVPSTTLVMSPISTPRTNAAIAVRSPPPLLPPFPLSIILSPFSSFPFPLPSPPYLASSLKFISRYQRRTSKSTWLLVLGKKRGERGRERGERGEREGRERGERGEREGRERGEREGGERGERGGRERGGEREDQ